MEESETLAETASKLERLRLMAHKDRADDGTAQEETEQALESHEVVELQAFVLRKEWIEEKIQVSHSILMWLDLSNHIASVSRELAGSRYLRGHAGTL